MRSFKKAIAIVICMMMVMSVATACASDAKKAMNAAVDSANELLEKGDEPYDSATKKNLEAAVASAEEAKDDDAYTKVTDDIGAATKAYEDSVRQLKQVTNPEESFLVERCKAVDTVTDVEAATEETDENNMMNKPGGYTSYIAMKSDMVEDDYLSGMGPVEAGADGGAVIEAFPTKEDAEAREQYLAGFDSAGAMASGSHVVVGTLVVRTSNELKASQQKELEKNIIDALIRLED